MGKFFWVNLSSKNHNERILMEEGTRFENKTGRYTMGSDGKLSIFNKETQETTIGDAIQLKDYQYQVLSAVIDNNDDGKNVAALSNADIKEAMTKYSKGELGSDLATYLKGNYEVENPRKFSNENKFSAYITNGNKKTSAVLAFQYDVKIDKTNAPKQKIENNQEVTPTITTSTITTPVKELKGAFTGANLFSNPAIVEKKPFEYTVKEGDDLVKLAVQYEIDTYQLIVANPQLKEGKDYTITYPKDDLADMKSHLKKGQKITIPARYDVKKGSCKNLTDVARITGVSKEYLYDFLTVVEPETPHKADLTTYLDDGGTPTIGYGHTGRVDGKPLSMKHKITITEAKALEILAEDILKHKAMTMAYLGKDNYTKAPKSVQNAILDVAYNKGIWDGYLTPHGYAASTSKIKKDLENKNYDLALVHTRREKTGYRGLRKRNLYRFISGLTDLTPTKRKSAMDKMQSYYEKELAKCKHYDRPALKAAWENARLGKTSGYTLE